METVQTEKGTKVVFVLLTVHNLLVMFPYLACAGILTTIMEDLAIPPSASAFVISIIAIISGICMFFGGSVINRLGYVKGFNCAIALEVLGTAITAIAPSFLIFMLGRVLFAIGFGLNTAIIGALASMWFPGAKYATFNTVYLIGASVGGALAYIVIDPLMTLLGSWQGAYLAFAGVLLVYCIICFVFIKYPTGVEEGLAQQKAAIKAGLVPPPEFSLKRVLRRKNYLFLTAATLFPTITSGLFQTYLPTYLIVEGGMDITMATSITGVGVFAGIAGSLIGGILVARSGRRKIFNLLGNILFVAAGLGVVLFQNALLILVMYILLNVGFYFRMPAMSQYYLEEIVPYDPDTISPAVALVNGVPMLLSLIGSAIASPMTVSAGYGKTLFGFQALCVLSIVFSLMMTECGPNAKNAGERET